MKKNTPKLLVAALALLIALGIAAGSTYAWFSMNNRVTVTGMNVTTKVQNSLLIAPCETATTGLVAANLFRTSLTQDVDALLEPVSTVNGASFFYNSTKNVDGRGDAIADTYVAYNPTDTTDFNTNYDTTGAVGYVDYAFQLQAVNAHETDNYYVNLTKCDLTYNGAATTEKAFRVAVFVWDMGATGSTAAGTPAAASLLTILREDGAAYFTSDSAISNAGSAPTAVASLGTAAALSATAIAPGATNYYKVVVRLWLEGEDTTCTNTTFATLTSDWALDLEIELQNATTGAINNIND